MHIVHKYTLTYLNIRLLTKPALISTYVWISIEVYVTVYNKLFISMAHVHVITIVLS